MGDLHLPWGGDFTLDDTNDLRWAVGVPLATQRVARAFMTNSAEYDSQGNVTQMGDDPFDQSYGESIGRDVHSLDKADAARSRASRMRKALSEEVTIDQSVPPTIVPQKVAADRYLIEAAFTTLDGSRTSVGYL